jgi:hypothetical protein
LRPLKTLRDKTNDQTSEKPKSKPVMQTSLLKRSLFVIF